MKTISTKIITLFFGVLVFFSVSSCISDDYFGKYDKAKILTFAIENQIGTVNIDHEALLITVLVDEASDITRMRVTQLEVSSFASVSPKPGETIDFSAPAPFTVIAENGTEQVYNVIVKRSQAEIQLSNSDFQNWYQVTGSKTYYEPGLSKEETVWGTGNPGVVTLGAANVTPYGSAENVHAILKTVELPLGALLGQGIGAGSMFTGFFKLNLSNPISSAKFGVPYSARPEAFSVAYKYSPGPVVKTGKLVSLPAAKDSCDFGIILTDRSSEPYKQVAVAWFRSGENITEWKTITLNFKYGAINSPAIYERPKDIYILDNGSERLVPCVYGTGNEKPTHITVVFASSHRGDYFEGAPGSELYIDDLVLKY